MSLTKSKKRTENRAEAKFRAAFERLKSGQTEILPSGTRVSQNAVAKEAGVVPSALRPSRMPELCTEIAKYIKEHENDPAQKSGRQQILAGRNARRALRDRMMEVQAQRDLALSKLISAEAHILELTQELEKLRANSPGPVVPIRPAERSKAVGKKSMLRVVDE